MPYMIVGKCVHKQNDDGKAGETVPGGCHDTEEQAKEHMRALYANVNDSLVEMSMRISKASYNKSEKMAMKWEAIDSDVNKDLYGESMSTELYKDFISRIENNTPVPEEFKSIVCEDDWCGGMPYLSIAHYKSGSGAKNVPGLVSSVFMDGIRLKSKGKLYDNSIGRKVWDALREDMYMEKSGNQEHLPVRISIGFLDLEHKHVAQAGGQDFTFTREAGKICPLCSQGIGGKIYMKGQLIHLALTRVPVNPRTQMVTEKSMDIQTKKDDAKSIIGELADELEEKSIASDVLVVRSEDGSLPKDDPSDLSKCYDPNTDSFGQGCIDAVMNKYMASIRAEIGTTVKSVLADVIEESKRKDVSDADKKHAEKEYGDVKFADEANKKYPIDTKEHAQAALSYWGMPKNREKYSPEDQKKIGGRIRSAAKKFGIEVTDKKSDVEDTMDEIKNESVAGIPEKPFSFTQDGVTVTGDGNNTIANPVKAKVDDEEDAKDKGDDEAAEGEKPVKKMSALDKSFEALKSTLASAKSVEDVQAAFNALGSEVEKSYTPEQKPVDATDLATIVRSAVEQAVAPLKVEIATLKAQTVAPANGNVVKSKALNIEHFTNPAQMIQKAETQPVRDPNDNVPMQIRSIARRSTGLQ